LYLGPQLLRAVGRALAGRFTQPGDEVLHRDMIVCHFVGTVQGLWAARHSADSGGRA
jgi:hypothetical protein